MLTKKTILQQLQTHFEAKREKGVGTRFPRVPVPLHPYKDMKEHEDNVDTWR